MPSLSLHFVRVERSFIDEHKFVLVLDDRMCNAKTSRPLDESIQFDSTFVKDTINDGT